MTTLGIYVQIPFCASKCSFCNFSSRVARPQSFAAYSRAVCREIDQLPELYASRGLNTACLDLSVDTLYFGGGTPSLLGPDLLGDVMDSLRRRFRIAEPVEFTLEITPGSASDEMLDQFYVAGVNRLSIGAQSFSDRELRAVGRLHSSRDTQSVVERARRGGFGDISLDLIGGLPYQTAESWQESLKAAVELRPEHLSVYLFEIDEKSRLGREVLDEGTRYHAGDVPDETCMADAYETAREFLRDAGYIHYEISNFALPGYESRHNQKYWRREPYIGLGAGAHSFDGAHRWANATDAKQYEEMIGRGSSPVTEFRSLSSTEQMEEFFFLGLRQREGIDLQIARAQWGEQALERWQPMIASLAREGWLEDHAGRWSLAECAHLVSNEIFQKFLVD